MSGSGKTGDTTTDFVADEVPAGKYLVNPYEDWAGGEGVPILAGRAIDLMAAEVRPWARFGCHGVIAHVEGRCDFLTVFLHEIAPGRCAAPQQHIYDELVVVLAGTGETEIDMPDVSTRVVPWAPGTVLGAPTNASYRHRNTGAAPARLAAFNDLRYLMSLYRSERFIFENPLVSSSPLAGEVARSAGGGDGGALVFGSGTIGADLIEIGGVRPLAQTPDLEPQRAGQGSDPTRTARRQMQGAQLLGLSGEGRTLSWREGATAQTETRWRHGVVIGLSGMLFHRHSAVGGPARALDIQLGSAQFPMLRSRRSHYGDKSVYASGSAQNA